MAIAIQDTTQRIILAQIHWETYQALLTDLADRHAVHMTYDRGQRHYDHQAKVASEQSQEHLDNNSGRGWQRYGPFFHQLQRIVHGSATGL
jgi:hypothetical protein